MSSRQNKTFQYGFLSFVLIAWSILQVVVSQLSINDTLIRSIHLAFALSLSFALWPFRKKSRPNSALFESFPAWAKTFFLKKQALERIAIFLAAGASALYLCINYQNIALRPGNPSQWDLIISAICIVFLLEACRRVLGLTLSMIALIFMAYALTGPYLPDLISHRGADLPKLLEHLYLGTEGIFGVPIRVSASFVFLFVLLGSLLDKAGAGKYFIDLAYSALGRFRGGPAKASVAASGLLGMLSGSSIANTVTTGTFTIPLMKKVGFSGEKAAAIEVAASTNAQLMPPVMGAAAFIMAEFTGIAYMDVVTAAFIPAVASYIALFAVVHFEACKMNIQPTPEKDIPPFWPTFKTGLHYFLPIVFLIYALMIQRQSPSTAAFKAIIMTLVIMLVEPFFKNEFKEKNEMPHVPDKVNPLCALKHGIRSILQAFEQGAYNMVPIAVATACAGIIIGVVTLTGLGQSLLGIIETLSGGNFILVLILTAVSCIILGMGLPTTANYIVMASLTAPVLTDLAQSQGLLIPVIAIHLFVFYFGILADDTPPVGLAAYAAAAIAKSDPIKTGIQGFKYDMRTAALPFIFIFNPAFIMIKGIKPGGSPMSPNDWIWIDSWPQALGLFTLACIGMLLFVSAITGYAHKELNVWQRTVLFILSALIFFHRFFIGY